jgi:hypothetical protein
MDAAFGIGKTPIPSSIEWPLCSVQGVAINPAARESRSGGGLAAGSWQLEAGSRKLEAGSRKLEA